MHATRHRGPAEAGTCQYSVSTAQFIGAGAVGGTLAVALGQAGYRVVAVAIWPRRPQHQRAPR